ncbi:MAG: chemotaxis protein CheB [Phycisphaerae bacterium]|nr:chemotaxis protein CheB [Phycisphaerae bacterium]
MQKRETVVLGGSAGGLEALTHLVQNLRSDFAASMFIVLHTSPHSPSMLAHILSKHSRVRVEPAAHKKPIQRNCIYTAIPDRHLMIDDAYMYTPAGPKENRVRPAIDPLFRSAAVSQTSCVTGIILTGMLDDGTSGLMAIKQCGGLAIVQDPRDARYPDMCRSALKHVKVDHVVALADMAAILNEAMKPCTAEEIEIPSALLEEVRFSLGEEKEMIDKDRTGALVPLTCPECGGPIWETDDEVFRRFRCYTGHNFTARALLAEIDEETEKSLWTSLQMLKGRTRMLERMADTEKKNNRLRSEKLFRKDAADSQKHAERVNRLLLSLRPSDKDSREHQV